MTNILKDVWEDRGRGACWLPQDVFARHGIILAQVSSEPFDPRFGDGYRELVGVAHAHLRNALNYTLLIPSREIGIRRFCLWAIGLAVLTLRKIERNPRFTAGAQVKVSRSAVAMTRLFTRCGRAQRLDAAAIVQDGSPRLAAWRDLADLRQTAARARQLSRRFAAPTGIRVREPNSTEAGNLPGTAAGCARRRRTRRHRVAQAAAHNGYAAGPRDRGCPRRAALHGRTRQGYWLFELEADCTIPAEYIMMMHFLDEIDAALETKICRHLRSAQAEHGGWPLYHGGDFNLSCSVKAYYALKLAGDSPDAPHMARARVAILQHGGAARVNVFTRIALALFGQIPWRGVPYIPVEIMLLPRWFPFHLDKVAYWSRTVMVPLFILCTRKPVAKNPRNVHIRELFTTPPEEERALFPAQGSPDQGVSGGGSTGALD